MRIRLGDKLFEACDRCRGIERHTDLCPYNPGYRPMYRKPHWRRRFERDDDADVVAQTGGPPLTLTEWRRDVAWGLILFGIGGAIMWWPGW